MIELIADGDVFFAYPLKAGLVVLADIWSLLYFDNLRFF